MHRRDFIKVGSLGAAALALSGRRAIAKTVDAHIEILCDEELGYISPLLQGQFTEHIGGVVYDGIWVGENSRIRNYHGLRADLVDKLKEIHVPIIRWPGGCFADSYNWRDGIGPRAKRPLRTNFWEVDHDAQRLHEKGAQIFESNEFGTDEFARFCQLTGAEPYLAANVRGLPALDFDQWVEYCNSPAGSTTLADARSEGGHPNPFSVRWWGVGNESWGCGGSFEPEDYAAEFRRYTTWVPEYGIDLQFVGSGPNDNDLDWTHRFFDKIFSGAHPYRNRHFTGWSVHHYAARDMKALEIDEASWLEVLRQCDLVETIIRDQWAAMGEYDQEHQVKLVVDEYGPWYVEGTELDITHLFGQQITMRDALATALTLDAFNRHPEKVCMGTNAQLLNNINALFLCHEDKFCVTPNYHVFGMYAPHQGGTSLRAHFSANASSYTYRGKSYSLWGLNGSASRKDGTITITAVNSDSTNSKPTQVTLRGFTPKNVKATALFSKELNAHNTVLDPSHVRPREIAARLMPEGAFVEIPPGSVVSLALS